MKIVFLDIDGVLNCRHTRNPRHLPYIVDPSLRDRLLRLLEETQAKIVLTSTWRYDPAGLFSADYWGIPYIDGTADLPEQPRRDEILQWLTDHKGVERYVVIDDDDDELDGLPLFQPKASEGLTEEIAAAAVDYLLGRRQRDMRRGRGVRLFQNVRAILRGHIG